LAPNGVTKGKAKLLISYLARQTTSSALTEATTQDTRSSINTAHSLSISSLQEFSHKQQLVSPTARYLILKSSLRKSQCLRKQESNSKADCSFLPGAISSCRITNSLTNCMRKQKEKHGQAQPDAASGLFLPIK